MGHGTCCGLKSSGILLSMSPAKSLTISSAVLPRPLAAIYDCEPWATRHTAGHGPWAMLRAMGHAACHAPCYRPWAARHPPCCRPCCRPCVIGDATGHMSGPWPTGHQPFAIGHVQRPQAMGHVTGHRPRIADHWQWRGRAVWPRGGGAARPQPQGAGHRG